VQIILAKFPHNSELGGGELHTITLVKNLISRGADCMLLSSDEILLTEFNKRKFPAKKLWAPLEPVSAKGLLVFPFLAPFFFFYLLYFLIRFKKEKNPSLYCLTYTEKVLMTPVARLLGFKVIWMEHLRVEKSYTHNPLKFLYNWFSKYVVVVTVSQAVGDQLVALGVKRENVTVIYNGIDTDFFKPSGEGKEDDTVTIGVAARLSKEKAIDDLIKAFAKAQKQYPSLELKIAGKGDQREMLEALAFSLGVKESVTFVGFQKDSTRDFLETLDIFALTSKAKESFGIAAAEAEAMGLPVVASNISGLTEVVKDKETGIVVPIGDIDAISDALLTLAKDPGLRRKYGEAARERVVKKFGEKTMIDAYEALFSGKVNE